MNIANNKKANEEISKFKLLSAYGGPGSILHTEYGSILVSCIEEWGFIRKIGEIVQEASVLKKNEGDHISEQTTLNDLQLSNDERLLNELRIVKNLPNLRYMTIIPDIELNEVSGTIKDQRAVLAINSTFMPKGFFDESNNYQTYNEWFNQWGGEKNDFFPPMKWIENKGNPFPVPLKQDNIALICSNGHISDFPWSKYLLWRVESPDEIYNPVDLFGRSDCCHAPSIQIRDTSSSSSGFDGKWIRCLNEGCPGHDGVSLKGLTSVQVRCPGHKPWEVETGPSNAYWGDKDVRKKEPKREACSVDQMTVALTTGNNLYFSKILSSIYMPKQLFLDQLTLTIQSLSAELEAAMSAKDFHRCIELNDEIKKLEATRVTTDQGATLEAQEREQQYRFQEFNALTTKTVAEINVSKDLVVANVTDNLDQDIRPYFDRILRIDNLKSTTAQLSFSRVEPDDSRGERSKNIFRDLESNVISYPVVENYGEGILIALSTSQIDSFSAEVKRLNKTLALTRNGFARNAVETALSGNWQLYLAHTLCHLIMRELEFRCGYPTASLSERIFSCNQAGMKMHGFMIYTAEGAEGSMGGLIAQTRKENLNSLIKSALKRATICNSDPLCWQSAGQGLFELNLASCFSCSLVSETSCEYRNIYLDRRVVVDEVFGFFKDITW